MTDQLYGSQSDAEREQIARAMSERAAVLKRAEMLEWAYARQAAREAPRAMPRKVRRRLDERLHRRRRRHNSPRTGRPTSGSNSTSAIAP